MIPVHYELSVQEAANLLNISKPYFLDLLKTRKIPYRKVGPHRKILTKDVLAYKMREDQARLTVLSELTAESQQLGFYEKIDMNK